MPNVTLAHVIETLSSVEASNETSSARWRAFASKKTKRKFEGRCNYCKIKGHKEAECRKKKADEGQGHRAEGANPRLACTANATMAKSEWLVGSGASSYMTSVRGKFVSLRELKAPVRIVIADGTKIDAAAIGTIKMKLKNGIMVTLLGVLYIPDVDGSLISVSKLAEKNVVAEFSKDKCVFRFKDAPVMEAK